MSCERCSLYACDPDKCYLAIIYESQATLGALGAEGWTQESWQAFQNDVQRLIPQCAQAEEVENRIATVKPPDFIQKSI